MDAKHKNSVTSSLAVNLERKPYEKPVLRTIDLALEEVMAVGCKTATGPSNFGGTYCADTFCAGASS